MRLKNLRLKLKRMSLKRFVMRRKSRKVERVTWMNNVSHGYHVVELGQTWATPRSLVEFEPVVVQREQTEDCELWYFSVFDDVEVAEDVTNSMQSNFLNKLPKKRSGSLIMQSNIEKKCKESVKRALLNARPKTVDGDWKSGYASATVINGKRLVMASTGGCTVVVCRDGEAYQITPPQCPVTYISGSAKVQKTFWGAIAAKSWESAQVGVGSERIDSETEFVILASSGVWEVMREQEAVNLIRHIENPQAAAECLANEALIRKTKSIVSCLIIRFH